MLTMNFFNNLKYSVTTCVEHVCVCVCTCVAMVTSTRWRGRMQTVSDALPVSPATGSSTGGTDLSPVCGYGHRPL